MVIGKAKGACLAAEVLCECSILIMFCVLAELSVGGGGGVMLIPFYGLGGNGRVIAVFYLFPGR